MANFYLQMIGSLPSTTWLCLGSKRTCTNHWW